MPATDPKPEKKEERGLVTAGKGIYRDLPQLLEAFEALRDRFNVCFPVMKPDLIPPLYSIALRPVAIDNRTDLDAKGQCVSADLYQDKKQSKFGLSKIALDKLAAAAGLSWHPAYTGRVDDESTPYFRRYRAVGVVLNLDGTPRFITAHKTVDLRDGSPEAKKMSEDQLREARIHLDALCESKAMNRVIRKYAFIKGLYTKEELARPFVIAALVLTGETDDPEMRREFVRATVQRATSGMASLFGPAAATPIEIPDLGQRTAPPPLGVQVEDEPDEDAEPEKPAVAAPGAEKQKEMPF